MFIIGTQDEGMLYNYPLTCTGKSVDGIDEWINDEGVNYCYSYSYYLL